MLRDTDIPPKNNQAIVFICFKWLKFLLLIVVKKQQIKNLNPKWRYLVKQKTT